MKIKKDKQKKRKILLIDKDKEIKNYSRKKEKLEKEKCKSTDFEVVSMSGVSFSDVVKKKRKEEKSADKKKLKNFFIISLFFIFFLIFVFFMLIRFKYINLEYFKTNVDTSFLYKNTEEEILKILFEYKKESISPYMEINYSFNAKDKEILSKEFEEQKNKKEGEEESEKEINESKGIKLLKKYKEVLEQTKLEFKSQDLNNNISKREINLWAYNEPILQNSFLLKNEELIYDSLKLNEKIKIDQNEFRKYIKKHYFFDLIDNINEIDKEILGKDIVDKVEKLSEEEKNISPNIDYKELNYERELNSLYEIITHPNLKKDILDILEITRDDSKIVIGIDFKNKNIESFIKKIFDELENESFKRKVVDYLYIYLNRKPKYLIKEYSKNELSDKINKIIENKEEFIESLKNLKTLERLDIVFLINNYNSTRKSKNKISKVEYAFKTPDLLFSINKSISYQDNKDIKGSSKKNKSFKDEAEVFSNLNQIINYDLIKENKNKKFFKKILEIKQARNSLEENEAVKDAKDKRSRNIINPELNKLNEILKTRVIPNADYKKINVQDEVKNMLEKEYFLKTNKNNKITELSFKSDIDEKLKTSINVSFNLETKKGAFNIKTKLNDKNLLDINEYKYIIIENNNVIK